VETEIAPKDLLGFFYAISIQQLCARETSGDFAIMQTGTAEEQLYKEGSSSLSMRYGLLYRWRGSDPTKDLREWKGMNNREFTGCASEGHIESSRALVLFIENSLRFQHDHVVKLQTLGVSRQGEDHVLIHRSSSNLAEGNACIFKGEASAGHQTSRSNHSCQTPG
jgi:hypothetical protein